MRCRLVAIKEPVLFFLLFPVSRKVVRLPLRTSIAVPWVRVSNAFYASLRLRKAGNSGWLPSLSLFVFRFFMSVNHLFGHFWGLSCNLLVMQSSASGGG